MEVNHEMVRIVYEDDIDRYRVPFTKLYQQAYAGPPYFESFTDADVLKIMHELTFNINGICAVMMNNNGKMIGLCGGYSIIHEPHIVELLWEHMRDVHPAEVFYMADVVVDNDYRKQGLGTKMVDYRINRVREMKKIKMLLMRTQAENSNSKGMYIRKGFSEIPEMAQEVETYIHAGKGRKLTKQRRIFLYQNL